MVNESTRKYISLEDTVVGATVITDDSFNCIPKDSVLTIQCGKFGLYIPCSEGHHELSSMMRYEGYWFYKGLYPLSTDVNQ